MLLSLLVLVAPLVSALTISAPTNVTSGGVFTIRWTSATGDPYVNQNVQSLFRFPFSRWF